MIKLVLMRHGQSQWNLENRFTGWKDVPLTEQGILEAKWAAESLKKNGYDFDIVFTSFLKRAIQTLNITLNDLDMHWLPVLKSWRLNERHYGALQGLNKQETIDKHGADQVHIWRRSYDIQPPPLEVNDSRYIELAHHFPTINKDDLPRGESLLTCKERVLPYWEEFILPQLKNKQKVLIVAHGNSLRALVQHLDQVSPEEITQLNIPTGVPLVYELDDNLTPLRHYYLEK